MLPMLLGLLGGGLAGTGALGGIAAGLSPIAAGAIGSGLGSFIETGDLGEGIKSGLMSFAGGKLMGSIMNSASPGALEAGTQTPSAAAASASLAPETSIRPMPRPEGLAASGVTSLPTPGMMEIGKRGFDFAKTPAGIGSSVGAALAPAIDIGGGGGSDSEDEKRDVPGGRDMSGVTFPTSGYDSTAEFDYNFPGPYQRPTTGTSGTAPTAYANGGMLSRYVRPSMMGMETRLAAGGLADLAEADMPETSGSEMPEDMPMESIEESSKSASPNDKEIIVQAVKAIKSGTPDDSNKVALADFVQRFGEDALMDLVDSVQRGDFEDIANMNEGMIRGPGDAMDDLVPAKNTGNGEDILLSGEEFIVPGDVVSGLGNGSSDAGADELYKMMNRVRVARTGTTEQPPQIKAGGLLPA
jgi:hypothetical protein